MAALRASESDTSLFDGAKGDFRRLPEARDWSGTPLGAVVVVTHPADDGPDDAPLRFANIDQLGAELVAVNNEAYVPLLGAKHPRAVGRSPKYTWQEDWESPGCGNSVHRENE